MLRPHNLIYKPENRMKPDSVSALKEVYAKFILEAATGKKVNFYDLFTNFLSAVKEDPKAFKLVNDTLDLCRGKPQPIPSICISHQLFLPNGLFIHDTEDQPTIYEIDEKNTSEETILPNRKQVIFVTKSSNPPRKLPISIHSGNALIINNHAVEVSAAGLAQEVKSFYPGESTPGPILTFVRDSAIKHSELSLLQPLLVNALGPIYKANSGVTTMNSNTSHLDINTAMRLSSAFATVINETKGKMELRDFQNAALILATLKAFLKSDPYIDTTYSAYVLGQFELLPGLRASQDECQTHLRKTEEIYTSDFISADRLREKILHQPESN